MHDAVVEGVRRPRLIQAFKVHRADIEGGIPNVVSQLSHGLAPRWRQSVVVARVRGAGDRRVEDDGVELVRAGSFGTLWSLPLAPTYPSTLRREAAQADLLAIHAPFPLADVVAAFALPPRVRLVVHWHADIVRQRAAMPVLRPIIARVLARAARIVVSHDSVTAASALLAPFAAKTVAIPYGIDASAWSELTSAQRERVAHCAAQSPRLVVAVGRLVGYKGFDVLIDAMRHVDGELTIVGEGAERAALQQRIDTLGLGGRVTLMGGISHDALRTILHAAKVFVLPSVSIAEAFGIVQLEAMACGCAIVNTALPTAVPWVARDGHEAVTVPPREPVRLAAAINGLLDDPARAARLAQAGVRRLHEMFLEEQFVAAVDALYRRVLEE